MDTAIIVAVISAAAALIVQAVSSFLTRSREREADWRKQRLEYYRRYFELLNKVVATKPTDIERKEYAIACSALYLVAPSDVMMAMKEFQDKRDHPRAEREKLLGNIVWVIRKDLGFPPSDNQDGFDVRLWGINETDHKRK
ncbi:hypothetical protein [Ferrovibrio xuzhouensis]|uniref:Uncharacterized protein n=1 Tax=Ferrovibrio xuzhouensis TaxID=1576914 RepID=A0ABV7VLT3_9PROT